MRSFNIADMLEMPKLPEHLDQVERQLDTVLTSDIPYLAAPLKRLRNVKSKRLRSCLVLAAAASSGREIGKSVINVCVAVELVHIASLVHDDIIDNADTRWDMPTINKVDGLDQAILVGDYLFAKANELAASINPSIGVVIAKTVSLLCEGQANELADIGNTNRTIDSYLKAIRGKTASLTAASCQVGALAIGLESKKVQALSDYGEHFGMAFQLVDDVLDLLSTPELLGKPIGNDIKEGVYTMPIILALQGPDRKKLLHELQIAKKLPFNARYILNDSGAIEQTIQEAKKYNQHARESISGFASEQLQNLPDAYLNWALENLIQ